MRPSSDGPHRRRRGAAGRGGILRTAAGRGPAACPAGWCAVRACLALLAGAWAGTAAAQVPEEADSLRLREPVRVEGGSILSTREVRSRLPFRPDRALSRAEIEAALSRLGSTLIEEARLEASLRLEASGEGGVLRVEEGPEARWDTLRLARHGAAEGPSAAGPRGPARGERFDAGRLERALDEWVRLRAERGHPYASARVESVLVSGGEVRAAVRLEEGPFCRVAEVAFPGVRATRAGFLRRWLGFRPGQPYRESFWEVARPRLERTGLFRSTGDPELEEVEPGRLRVLLPVEEGRHNRIEGAIGYSGREASLSGFVDLGLGNLFGAGRSVAVRWDRLRRDQTRLRLFWREPILGPLPLGSRLELDQEDRDSTLSRLTLEGRLETALGRDLSLYAGGEYHRSLLGAEPSARVRRVSSLLGLRWETLRLPFGRARLLDASLRTGRSRVRPPGGGAERRVRLERGALRVEEARAVRGAVGARLRATGEAIGRDDPLPVSDALRFGGAATLRGYEEESIEARRFLALQFEVGPAFPGGQAYLFADGAWWRAFPVPGRDRDAVALGVGIRADDARRSVALDLGIPRGRSPGEGRLHIRMESRF